MLILLIVLLPTLACAEPSVQFEVEQHDFGQVQQGDQLEFAFHFSNQGADELSIKNITGS
jgi:imidazole glycerol phosphate synthase subunit HisF